MTTASGQWTLSVLIGAPLLGLLITAALAVSVACFCIAHSRRDRVHDTYDTVPWTPSTSWRLWGAGFTALSLVITAAALIGYWPLKAAYHQYRPVNGTVRSVGNRLISAGDKGGSNQKFVLILTSGPQQYGVDDTRAALLKPGDTVHLRCVRVYQYGSNDAGYDCKWGQ